MLESQPKGYVSSLGDVAVVNMRGYEKTDKGEKGEPLPSVASGDKVEVGITTTTSTTTTIVLYYYYYYYYYYYTTTTTHYVSIDMCVNGWMDE